MSAPDFTIEAMDPAQLAPHPENFRRHPVPQKEALRASVSEHGWLAAPIFNARTRRLLDGHARVENAIESGDQSIPVRVIDVSEDQERRILASFDQIGELRERDDAVLAALLTELRESEAGLPAGWGQGDLDVLLQTIPKFDPVDEDVQGRLDEKAKVTCPECGHQFAPA